VLDTAVSNDSGRTGREAGRHYVNGRRQANDADTHFAASGGVSGKAHGPHNKHAQQVLARRAAIERKRRTSRARLGSKRAEQGGAE
jgi:hypothetical protein